MRPLLMCSCGFFFSRRRRHTRYWRDWSSDVCSSDLLQTFPAFCRKREADNAPIIGVIDSFYKTGLRERIYERGRRRSEERRVGKECRFRGAPEQYRTKSKSTFMPTGYHLGDITPHRG